MDSQWKSGVCNETVCWKLNLAEGCLTVSGNGPMPNYESVSETPWSQWKDDICQVVVEDGVTSVGDYAFDQCGKLAAVTLAQTVEIIGVYSIARCPALKTVVLPEGVRVICSRAFSTDQLTSITLPKTLKAIDYKTFEKNTELSEVFYGGTKAQWQQICVSTSAQKNHRLLQSLIHYEYGQNEAVPAEQGSIEPWRVVIHQTENYRNQRDRVRQAVKNGGDGQLYVVAFDISRFDTAHKPGDSTLLVFPDGQTMLIDAGMPYCGEKLVNGLRDLGITSLDYFVLSHSHIDHVGGAMDVATYIIEENGGTIGTYYASACSIKELEPALREYLASKGTRIENHVKEGDVWEIGDARIELLSPSGEAVEEMIESKTVEINPISLVMKVSYGKAVYLTAGDLYRKQERELIGRYGEKLQATVVKGNHHACYTSNSEAWLDAVNPSIVIAEGDDIGTELFAEYATEKVGAEYYATGYYGTVIVGLKKDGTYHAESESGKQFCRELAR